MDLEALREHCLSRPAVTEDFPFGPDVLVFRVGGKIFVLANLEAYPPSFTAKCDPERVDQLRAEHEAIAPGYHMNKRHWNTITLDGSLPPGLVGELVDHAYARVVDGLTKKARRELGLE